MPTLDITDEHRDRIESLRAELAAAHAGKYASVGADDTLNYLLDLAEAVDDPDRAADPEAFGPAEGEPPAVDDRRDHGGTPFDTNHVRDRLESRNRKHGDPESASEMDLYGIAAKFDVTGRSGMTKAELIEAILDAAERLAADPFAEVDIDLDAGGESSAATDENDGPERDGAGGEPDAAGQPDDEDGGDKPDADQPDADQPDDKDGSDDTKNGDGSDPDGSSQLDAMMSLLDTHSDKWREGDGDTRYEVDLPDGGVETARTKDDVRAVLFRNY